MNALKPGEPVDGGLDFRRLFQESPDVLLVLH
jgi:hypothetical protein